MNKAKALLMAVAVVGVVGGALAFKAKPGLVQYCIAPTTTTIGQTGIENGELTATGTLFNYRTTTNFEACVGAPGLTLQGRIISE